MLQNVSLDPHLEFIATFGGDRWDINDHKKAHTVSTWAWFTSGTPNHIWTEVLIWVGYLANKKTMPPLLNPSEFTCLHTKLLQMPEIPFKNINYASPLGSMNIYLSFKFHVLTKNIVTSRLFYKPTTFSMKVEESFCCVSRTLFTTRHTANRERIKNDWYNIWPII